MQLLTFMLNGIFFGIPVSDVEGIETRVAVVGIPDSPANMKGIVKLHGEIVPIYSLASRFGYKENNIENIVIAGVNGMKIGLEVETVKEIIEVEDTQVNPMPQIMNATQNCFNNVVSVGKDLIVILSAANLISLEEQQSMQKLIDESTNK